MLKHTFERIFLTVSNNHALQMSGQVDFGLYMAESIVVLEENCLFMPDEENEVLNNEVGGGQLKTNESKSKDKG